MDLQAVARLDPYSQWLLGLGAAFDFTREETEEHPSDFDYLATIREDDVGDIGREGEIELAFAKDFDLFEINKLAESRNLQLAFRAPLRNRSVAPTVRRDAGRSSPDWKKPEGFDDDASERPVVVGIVDDAINPVHHRFRAGDSGVRMDFFWRQDGVWTDCPTPPTDLQFGREFTRDVLERAVAAHGDDDDRLFAELGLSNFSQYDFNRLARRRAHGTHVLDTAGGADPVENKVRRRLIAVQLPALTTLETSGATTTFFFLKGLEYILARARLISNELGMSRDPVPVVLNFSYGFAGGPHNGHYILERLTKQIIDKHWKAGGGSVYITHPSGNRQLRRGHAVTARRCAEDPVRTTLELPWRILPADRSPNYLEVWAPLGTAKCFHVEVVQPNGDRDVVAVRPDAPQALALTDATDQNWPATAIARATVDDGFIPEDHPGADLRRLLLIVSPTDTEQRARDPAPAGIWRVNVSAELEPGQSMHAWIQRDEPPSGFRKRGEQSYFDDPAYQRFKCDTDILDVDPEAPATPVRRRGTISGLTTGSRRFQGEQGQIGRLFVAGAYWGRRNDDRATSFYSASGLSAGAEDSWPEREPSLGARADTSRTLRGILGAGARSGCRFAMSGTSVAAPQVARAIADRLAEGHGPVEVEDLIDDALGEGEPNREGRGRLREQHALRFQIDRDA